MTAQAWDAEIIIIGGGAAGCSAAIHLARRGRQALLLEGRVPRPPQLSDIHSGEVLSPGAQQELAGLGLGPDGGPVAGYLDRWYLQSWDTLENIWPNGRRSLDRLPGGLRYWQINRGCFYLALQDLARAAGVQVRTGHRVTGLLQDAQGRYCGVEGRTAGGDRFELRAPVTLDAGGRYSLVVARLGLRRPEPQSGRAAYLFFFENLEGRQPPPGLWQSFWLRNATTLRGSRLAAGLYRYSLETSLAERQRWLDRFGRPDPFELFLKVLDEQLPREARRFAQGRRLPHTLAFAPIGYRVSRLTFDGLLLVGDAAGYLDPATGQGIEFALRMGRLAAACVAHAFEANRFDRAAFAPYLAGREAELQPVMRQLGWFLRLSRQPAALNLAGYAPPLRRAIIRQLVRPRPASLLPAAIHTEPKFNI